MAEDEVPEHLVRLNPEQERAVTTLSGPLLVLAGAGSGKTRVLTRRIAHLLYTGVDPNNVIALTFTNKAAAEMRERVAELIGDAAERVWVSTFHSSCARILRMDIEALGFTKRFAIYDDDDQVRLLKSIVVDAGYDPTRVVPRDVLSQIDGYKNQMRTPDQVVQERRTHVGDPVIRVWRDYEEALKASDALDFNDLVGKTVELFQDHPDVLEKWRDRFQYVLVDEYQDTNRAQYLLLRLLAVEHRNIAVVGDDDQSIYGFRGADVSNILNFQEDYAEAKVVRLEQNYRSTGYILTLANAVVAHNPDRLDKRLWTESANGAKVQLIVRRTVLEEATRVADAILKLRRMGHEYKDIAIIYRTKSIARHFEGALRRNHVAYRVVGGRKFYARREVRDLLSYLRVVVNPVDDAAVLRVINVPPRGVGAKTLQKVRNEANKRGQPLLSTARALGGAKSVGERGMAAFASLIDDLTLQARDLDLGALVAEVVSASGYRAMLEADRDKDGKITRDAQGRIENLDLLVQDATNFQPPPGAHAPIDHLTAWLDSIALTADADDVPEGGEVTLMTVHASKGLEFPVVFVVQMNEDVFPHQKSAEVGLEEERRLAYVAFTRAMKRLVVTRSLEHPTFGGGGGRQAKASRFLYGIPLDVVDGDLPMGEPASGGRGERLQEARETTSRLGTFLEHRRQRAQAAPEHQYTLVEIEDAEQLAKGVRVHHPRYGIGEITVVQSSAIYVNFEGRQQRIAAPATGLRIVAE
ncbi:MAG: UvrD-helicase domain-containing protein [Myxococcales bacterium]|nr:UvrD-helicase domain-containing protein [Myxococcales bacterium]